MLKIKFNINEFIIIFLRRFEGKNERKRIFFSVFSASALFSCFLFSATFLFSVQRPFSSFFFFFFCFSPPFLFKRLLFCFFQRLLFVVFLQPYVFKGQPKTCCSLKSPKRFASKAPTCCSFQFSPTFLFQPFFFSIFFLANF